MQISVDAIMFLLGDGINLELLDENCIVTRSIDIYDRQACRWMSYLLLASSSGTSTI